MISKNLFDKADKIIITIDGKDYTVKDNTTKGNLAFSIIALDKLESIVVPLKKLEVDCIYYKPEPEVDEEGQCKLPI